MCQEKEMEFDSNDKAWEHYSTFKRIEFKQTDLEIKGKRKILKRYFIIDKYNKTSKLESVKLGGDCFFNFNKTKGKLFQSIIDKVKSQCEKQELMEMLVICKDHHHSEKNLVLLPVSGGLNNAKQKCYHNNESMVIFAGVGRPGAQYDRGDTFIYALNEAYKFIKENKKRSILESGDLLSNSIFKWSLNTVNFGVLYEFIDSFDDINDFCSVLFNMDEIWVSKMIESGKEPITDAASLKRYMEFCIEYWKFQENNNK